MKLVWFTAVSLLLSISPVLAERHGLITSQVCPYSCRTQGMDKRNCRDWKNGNTCYIEDLTRTPANSAPPVTAPNSPTHPPIRPDHPINPLNTSCDTIDRAAIAAPSVYISEVKSSGNFFGSKLKVRGYVEGICLAEAGGYENGRRVASIPIIKTSNFKRFEFAVTLDGSNGPEIRVYNINGERDVYQVENYNSSAERGSTWSW